MSNEILIVLTVCVNYRVAVTVFIIDVIRNLQITILSIKPNDQGIEHVNQFSHFVSTSNCIFI